MNRAIVVAAAVFGALLLILALRWAIAAVQDRVTTPPPPQATLEAVIGEATRTAQQATQAAADRHVLATADAIQTETADLQTRTAQEAGTPRASPTAGQLSP